MSQLAIHGGPKACDHAYPAWPMWDDAERTLLNGVLESGKWWFGEKVHEFERRFAEFQGAKYGIACTNGTAALEAALLALGVGAGDEVIVPPLTFLATASAVLRVNAIPVFADIEGDTICIDPTDIERKITPSTKAIIPVHFAGYVCDMDRINAIATKHGLCVLEDACHSWGSQWKGKGTGALGHCGAFSFQESKNITSGEGGIILTDDEAIADRCQSYINCGRGKGTPWYEHFVLGGNLRMTEFQGALLLAQLSRLGHQTAVRERNAALLTEGLRTIPSVMTLRDEPRMTRRSYHLYPFRVDLASLGVTQDQFFRALKAEGAFAVAVYPHALYKNPLFLRQGDGPEYCPVSCPYHQGSVDYASVFCTVCEQVLDDMIWIWHTALLCSEDVISDTVAAIRKVVDHADELRKLN